MSTPERPGYELALLLLLGFRRLVDDLHARLAEEGHPDVRPLHGFVFQAIGPDGTTAAGLARRLGVSKQAAAKTIARLESLGYVERGADAADARRTLVTLTPRGEDCLRRSARIFDELRAGWAEEVGAASVRRIEDALERLAGSGPVRLDVPGWFG